MDDPDLRSRFHSAYDAVARPAPWLGAAVGERLRQRRRPAAKHASRGLLRLPWLVPACAVIVIVAIAVALLVGSRIARQAPVPGGHGSFPCLGSDFMPPNEVNAPGNPSPLPAALPPAYNAECGAYLGSSDSSAALAAFYGGVLTKAGWTVNTAGQVQGFVVTRWTPDPKVTGGPQPGYKPAFTGLTGDDVANATAVLDQNGINWVVNVRLTTRGSALFADLTRANVAACPGDSSTDQASFCPQRYLAFWVRLTQDDIDHWEDSAYAAGVSRPFDSVGGPQDTYPTLLSDAVTLTPITGGQFQIALSTRESAGYIAQGFNTRLLGSHVQLTFTKGHAFGVIDLVPEPDGTAIWVRVVS